MTNARILLADDSMVVRAVIRKQLADEGYEIVEVGSGEEVLSECRRFPPDVVLLDVEMPGISGYQVLSTMQTEHALESIPVIFLSGRVSSDDVATGLRLGAHDYLRKPVETGELLARVAAALRVKRRHDELQRDVAHLREVAPVDTSTGLLDAKALAERIRAWAKAERSEDALLGGILIVVDGLDPIVMRYGEEAAEEVFSRIAEAVRIDLRGNDVLGRCGPLEMLALLPGADHAAADAVARRLRSIACSTPVVIGNEVVTVSVDIGVATTADGDQDTFVRELQRALIADRAERVPAAAPVLPPPPPPPSDPRITTSEIGVMDPPADSSEPSSGTSNPSTTGSSELPADDSTLPKRPRRFFNSR